MDTAGEDDYVTLRMRWLQEREGFLFVFSIADRNSFLEIQDFFKIYNKIYPNKDKAIILIGNKVDL